MVHIAQQHPGLLEMQVLGPCACRNMSPRFLHIAAGEGLSVPHACSQRPTFPSVSFQVDSDAQNVVHPPLTRRSRKLAASVLTVLGHDQHAISSFVHGHSSITWNLWPQATRDYPVHPGISGSLRIKKVLTCHPQDVERTRNLKVS